MAGDLIPLYAMLDVWTALYGTSHPEFDEFYDQHGYAETWAHLLSSIRERRTVQGEPSDALIDELNATVEWPKRTRNLVDADRVMRGIAALRAAAETGGER